jgi:hypothetical protein
MNKRFSRNRKHPIELRSPNFETTWARKIPFVSTFVKKIGAFKNECSNI